MIKESSGSKHLFTVKPIGHRADGSVVIQPRFRRITWGGEKEQHWMPAGTPVIPDAPMLCGRRLPPFDGVEEDDEAVELKTKPMCRRCSRAWAKIFRQARRAFAASVERDLASLPIIDEPVTGSGV